MVKFFLNLKDCIQYAGTDYTQDSQQEFFSGFWSAYLNRDRTNCRQTGSSIISLKTNPIQLVTFVPDFYTNERLSE